MGAILQFLVGLVPVLEALKAVWDICYQIWLDVPFFHKPAAVLSLRTAVSLSKKANDPAPMQQWADSTKQKFQKGA